jgi:sulfur-oxidizing protein SoxX
MRLIRRPARTLALLALAAGSGSSASPAVGETLVRFEVRGDAIPASLTGKPGEAARGRRIVIDREVGNCLICHSVPEPQERFQGDLGPSLSGVGRRLSAGQIRLRLVDQTRLNAATIMPAYYRTGELRRVAERYAGKPVLTAAEIEDVVAYLATLRD